MKRKSIRSLAFVIDGLGINVTEDKTVFKIWRYVCCMVLFVYTNFTLSMYAIAHRGNFYEAASPIIFITGSQIMMVGVSFILYGKKKLNRLLRNVDGGIFTYPDEDRIVINYSWFLNEKNNLPIFYIVLSAVLFAYSFLFAIAVAQFFFYKRIKIFIYPNWTPWKGDGVTYQITSLISQHVTVMCGLWFYYVVCVFLIATACEFARQIDRLCAAIRSLNSRTEIMAIIERDRREVLCQNEFQQVKNYRLQKFEFKRTFDGFFKENVINCAKHHQMILRNYKLFQSVFKPIFSFELACCSVTLSLGLYCMVYAPHLELKISPFVVILVVNVNFFTRCFFGEQFANLNIKLKNTIFHESVWYEQNIENRQLLLMFHKQASFPFDLNGFSIFPASLNTFTKIIRTAYSFFNVLVKST